MRSLAPFALSLLFAAGAARAEERALTQLKIAPAPGKPPVDVWLMRATDGEGGLTIKLVARGVGPKAQAITIYSGGGGDEGAGEADAKSITMAPFELVAGHKGVRVDFTYRVPEAKHKEIETDTWIVGFVGKTHKLIEQLRTRFSQEKSKFCREREETALQAQLDAGEAVLVASTSRAVEAAYGEDDLPVDPTCRAPNSVERKAYKLEGLVEAPPPAPAPAAPPAATAPAPGTDKPAAPQAADKGAPKPAAPTAADKGAPKPAAPAADKSAPKPAAPTAAEQNKSPDGGAPPAADSDD